MRSPAHLMSSLLPNTIAGGATGWALFVGNMPDSPTKQVVFTDTGGMNPNPKWLLDFPTVQILVRGAKDSYPDTYVKARELRDFFLGMESRDVTLELLTYRLVSITGLGDIASLGMDQNDHPLISVNFRTIWEPPSGANREAL